MYVVICKFCFVLFCDFVCMFVCTSSVVVLPASGFCATLRCFVIKLLLNKLKTFKCLNIVMSNNALLSLILSIIPVVAIGFVCFLVCYKIYIKIRSCFYITVNCWFCNQNAKVPYLESNSWTCPSCEQYNGFNKDGDYNREIYEQLNCSQSVERFTANQYPSHNLSVNIHNGFCDNCNEAQRLKVEKLAQFQPKHEKYFDQELKLYKSHLEDQYRLCATCDRHLKKVLHEKKKMVLGSKFFDFIIKGAETLRQPHLNQIRYMKRQLWKQRCHILIAMFTALNTVCLTVSLPSINKEHITYLIGNSAGHYIFTFISHIIALKRVLVAYFQLFCDHHMALKIILFCRTLFMMIMYSMGLRVTNFSMGSMYTSICPFGVIMLAFMHNMMDGFRLTRYTFLLALWSVLAAGLVEQFNVPSNSLSFFISLLTLILIYITKTDASPESSDAIANSFHKLYSEDLLNDDDTMDPLNRCNGNCASIKTVHSFRSFKTPSPLKPIQKLSPVTSSTFSLHQIPHGTRAANSSFRSFGERPTFTKPSYFANHQQYCYGSFHELRNGCRSENDAFALNASIANNSIFNSSFREPQTHFSNCSAANESFLSASNSSICLRDNNLFTAQPMSGMLTPYSLSNNSIYSDAHAARSKLLSPTRFNVSNLMASPSCNTSWLSGGYFNQQPITKNVITTAIDENISRASSHSSGFESQNGRFNMSRENSCCPDINDIHQRTLTSENVNGFQPIESPKSNGSCYSSRPSLLKSSTLSLNSCSSSNNEKIWKTPQPSLSRKTNITRNVEDSFNLHKINEQLPIITTSDLLKKWKETQT
uniref:Ima1 N-terminal domain-containing protein n=1 Tax=Glossina brevipalpis TaxID=37001 RepID=A0A1A9W6D9_9MUSC